MGRIAISLSNLHMNFQELLDRVPLYDSLASFAFLHESTQSIKHSRQEGAHIRTVGHSQSGLPIEMISIGQGSRSVLLVGAPHPNEPIGCLTVEFLLRQLLESPQLLSELDYSWHFIKCIEPDGLSLNEAWLPTPHDLGAYLRGYFRPSLPEQAEYSFPLQARNSSFDQPTPENRAWQAAIHLARPDLMVSLHNAEHGGAFYVLSGPIAAGLPDMLASQPAHHGLPLDAIGEPFSEMRPLAEGVFESFLPKQLVDAMGAGFGWAGGDSSFGYVAPFDVVGLTVEVPYFKESDSWAAEQVLSLTEVFKPVREVCEKVIQLLDVHGSPVFAHSSDSEQLFVRSIQEAQVQSRKLQEVLNQLPDRTLPLPIALQQRRALTIALLRSVGMFGRLARMISTRSRDLAPPAAIAADAAEMLLASSLAHRPLSEGMVPVPLSDAVKVQVQAILTTAWALQCAGHNARYP